MMKNEKDEILAAHRNPGTDGHVGRGGENPGRFERAAIYKMLWECFNILTTVHSN